MAQRPYCQCRFANPPGSRFCAQCGGYVSADDGPLGRPIQWKIPNLGFLQWIGLALIVVLFAGVVWPKDPQREEKRLRAEQIFGEKLLAVSSTAPGAITRVLNYEPGPHLQVGEAWYYTPRRQKELFIEALGSAWANSCSQAELGDGNPGRVVLYDSSGNEVGAWGVSSGTHIERE